MTLISELIKGDYAIYFWPFMVFIAIVGFLTSIQSFFEFFSWIKKVKESTNDFDLAKRSTIKIAVGVAALVVVWPFGSSVYRSHLNRKKTFIVKHNKNLVTNKKTGTIHLKNVSTGELPSKKWETFKINLVKNKPYSGSVRRIYEEIAIEAVAQKNDFIAIEAYLLAIGTSPLSYHLYDKLTRIYGRKKEYTNIATLYDNALLNLPKLSLNKRHHKRANKEFTMRIQRTKHRSLLA